MKKRTFRLVVLVALVVTCLTAATLLAACNKTTTYYLSSQSNNWATYKRGETVPENVLFVQNGDGTYSLTVDLDEGDSFAIFLAGKSENIVKEIFSTAGKLTLGSDGKVSVGEKGKYVLTIDVTSGELTYQFTAATTEPQDVAVTGVSVDPTSWSMKVGDADKALTATVAPSNASNKNVTWSSDKNDVATVSSQGVVHAVSAGTAIITVTTEDGNKTATCTVTVSAADAASVAVTGVSVDPTSWSMKVGDADKALTATVAPSNASNKNVTWSSDKNDVATVSNQGVVHAVSAGTAVITVTTEDGSKTATCTVTVTADPDNVDVTAITLEKYSLELTLTEDIVSEILQVNVAPSNATNKSYKVEVVQGDEDAVGLEIVATGLKVTALQAGTLTIKLVSVSNPNVESDSITISVKEPTVDVTEITLTKYVLDLTLEEDAVVFEILQVSVAPSDATDKSYTWEIVSGDEDVVELEIVATGLKVTAKKAGTVTIKLVSVSNPDVKSDEIAIEVKEPSTAPSVDVTAITLNKYALEITMINGATVSETLQVSVAPSDATNKSFTWEVVSGDEEVASFAIVATGLKVTARKAGAVTIKLVSVSNPDVKSDEIAIEVKAPASSNVDVTSITLNKYSLELTLDDDAEVSEILLVTVAPSFATNKSYIWEIVSGDEDVAVLEIVATGLKVTAFKAGTVTIKLVSVSNPDVMSDEITIEVRDPATIVDVEDIYLEEDVSEGIELFVDTTETFVVVVYPDNATDKSYIWQLVDGDNDVVKVEITAEGLQLTGLRIGTVTIKLVSVSNPDVESEEITIEVKELTLQDLAIEPISLELYVGEEYDLVIVKTPANAPAEIEWQSLASDIVSVVDGHVKALAVGTAKITARDKTTDKQVECNITVYEHVDSISLSSSELEINKIGATREITVTINPNDAKQEFTVSASENGIVSWTISGNVITVTAEGEGTVTLTITSAESESIFTQCQITVDTANVVPTLDKDSVTITEISATATVNVLYDGDTSDLTITATSNATGVVTVPESISGTSFLLTGAGFGMTTVTVNVTYTDGSQQFTINVFVTSAYFYLTGPMDGGNSWPTYDTSDAAAEANRLMTKEDDGIYSITREFVSGDNFYILPAGLDDDWNYALKAWGYFTSSDSHVVEKSDSTDNAIVDADGLYKVTLNLTGTTASWTVKAVSIYPTGATISGNTTLQEEATTTTTLTLTIDGPSDKDVGSIVWEVETNYTEWLSLSLSDSNQTCLVELLKYEGEEDEVSITITVTINYGDGKSIVKEQVIKVLAAAAEETPVDYVTFDSSTYEFDVASSWSNIAVSATAKSNTEGKTPTNDKVVYSIVSGADIMYNGGSSVTFSIDSETGAITAISFGTIKVRAAAAEDTSKYTEIDVLIYCSSLFMAGSYGSLSDTAWENNATAYSSVNEANNVYTWTEMTFNSGDIILFLYNGSDWNKGVIRSSSYLGTISPSGVVSGTSGTGGEFDVVTPGIYTVTVNLTEAKLTVNFEKTGDLEEDPDVTVSLFSDGNTWSGTGTEFGSGTAKIGSIGGNYEIVFTVDGDTIIDAWSGSGWVGMQIRVGTGWGSALSITITYDKSSTSSNYLYQSGSTGNFTLDSSVISGKTLTITCTFDESTSALKSVLITSA